MKSLNTLTSILIYSAKEQLHNLTQPIKPNYFFLIKSKQVLSFIILECYTPTLSLNATILKFDWKHFSLNNFSTLHIQNLWSTPSSYFITLIRVEFLNSQSSKFMSFQIPRIPKLPNYCECPNSRIILNSRVSKFLKFPNFSNSQPSKFLKFLNYLDNNPY